MSFLIRGTVLRGLRRDNEAFWKVDREHPRVPHDHFMNHKIRVLVSFVRLEHVLCKHAYFIVFGVVVRHT